MSVSVLNLNVTASLVPKGYKSAQFAPLSAPSTSRLLPAGLAFTAHARRILNERSFAEDDRVQAEHAAANGEVVVEESEESKTLGGETEDRELLLSDPKLWKDQDHYAVLGLQELRYKANAEQIKIAHRRKCLRHHPDKKASAGGETNDDSFYKCIAKAMEVISNPEKRRQFDSVDPGVDDDDVPENSDVNADNFYALYGTVLEREGRFSKTQPVPSLGDKDSTKAQVENFYDFFYSIDSWRSFEYRDKDSPEGTDSRDEKRHQEKKNKSDRAKAKKDDIARVRVLVDRALSLDPRIKQFKADEKAARELKKRGGAPVLSVVDVKKAEEEAAAKKIEDDKIAAAAASSAADDKASREAIKKVKAAALKSVKKDKKSISLFVTSANYFCAPGTSPSPATVEGQLSELDVLFSGLEPEQVGEMKVELEKATDAKAVICAWAVKAGEKLGAGKFKEFA